MFETSECVLHFSIVFSIGGSTVLKLLQVARNLPTVTYAFVLQPVGLVDILLDYSTGELVLALLDTITFFCSPVNILGIFIVFF